MLSSFFMSVPSAPQNVTGEQLNATTVRLRWNPPKSPNGIITGFQVTYYGYRTTREVHLLHSESRATSIIHGLFLIIYKLNTYTHLSDIVCLVNTHPIHCIGECISICSFKCMSHTVISQCVYLDI